MTPSGAHEEKTTTARLLGIAALSSLRTPPDELVRMAADVGFDFVGVRVLPVTETDPDHDLSPGSPLQWRVLDAARDTGIRIHDTEFLLLDGAPDLRQRWLRALDAAAGLGARTFTVAGADTQPDRLAEHLVELTSDASERGILPTLEPISYQAVRSIPQAAALARAAGCAVLADTLHLARFGATVEELADAADVIGGIQLVDGPRQAPRTREELVRESRSARSAPGEGDFPLAEYLDSLPAELPVSVECCSDEYVAAHGTEAWVRHQAETARQVLAP